jgi:GTP-binding protein
MSAQFIITLGDSAQLPTLIQGTSLNGRREPRIAMVGRSNVGKSTLINALLEAKVAQVSNQPGKTRAIHFYLWKEPGRIVADLPGYGFAKTSHRERERWSHFISSYLKKDPALMGAVVLLDARHGPTELDEDAIRFLAGEGIPMTIVFSKCDQLKTQSERSSRKKEAGLVLEKLGYNPEMAFWVSGKTKDGLKSLAAHLSA